MARPEDGSTPTATETHTAGICIAPSSQANKHDIRILERMHVASTLLLRQEQTPGGAIEGLIVD